MVVRRVACVLGLGLLGCGGAAAQKGAVPPSAESVFDAVAPSVVAIVNDDRADREQEIKETEASLGDESHAPKHVVDVSLRKTPSPQGTGFMIEGGQVVTAAHVVLRPDRLKVTSRTGQTVDADVVRFDVVRDVAVLKPREPLTGTMPLALEEHEPRVGQPVWALGHTGHGYWQLSWGMSGGIASGIVDLFGARLLLFDAAVYPGFSGGPVVTVHEPGRPRVVGINHAILYTGMGGLFAPTGPISSAVAVTELREVLAGHPPAAAKRVADYAKEQRTRVWADLFVTDRLNVERDPNGQSVAQIMGNASSLEADASDTRVPCVAMVFGLPPGDAEVDFELRDPGDKVAATELRMVHIEPNHRVTFASAVMHFAPKTHGRYAIVAKLRGKEIGRSTVALTLGDDDDELVDNPDSDAVDDGEPDVDIVVAEQGNDNPLILNGIRSAWAERSYPRRVDFNWFARGTRGWSGTDVSVTAYVLDDAGNIVGRADGCFAPELRPEHTWACVGEGTAVESPLAMKAGPYDIVFAINDRPVAWWPMEAALRKDLSPGSDLERWMQELHRIQLRKSAAPKAAPKSTSATPHPPKPPAAHPTAPP